MAAGVAATLIVIPVGVAVAFPSAALSDATSVLLARDDFNRSVPAGLGAAERGGAWSEAVHGPAAMSVSGGAAHITDVAPLTSASAWLPVVSARDVDVTSTFSLPVPSAQASGIYLAVEGRRDYTGAGYRGKLTTSAAGAELAISRVGVHGAETVLGRAQARWAAPARTHIVIELRVSGTNPTVVSERSWPAGAATPPWQLTVRDGSTAQLTHVGCVGVWSYRSPISPVSNWKLTDLTAWSLPTAPSTPPSSPTSSSPAEPKPSPSSGSSPADPAPSTVPSSLHPTSAQPSSTIPGRTTSAPAPSSSTHPSDSVAPTSTSSSAAAPPSSGQPGQGNTGVPAGTQLTSVYGTMDIRKSGTYRDLDIHGFVHIDAPDVTIKDSIVRGGVANGDSALVTDLSNTATNFVLEDSELVPQHPSVYIDGIDGWNYTALRVNIHGTVDGAKMFGDHASLVDSWVHDLAYFSSDPNQDGKATHNDAVQVLGGSNLSIRNDTLVGGDNSALQVTQSHGPVSGLSLSNNWIGGGACTVNLQDAPRPTMSGISVDHNRFYRTSTYHCAIISYPGVSYTNSGNTWSDGTGPVSIVKRS